MPKEKRKFKISEKDEDEARLDQMRILRRKALEFICKESGVSHALFEQAREESYSLRENLQYLGIQILGTNYTQETFKTQIDAFKKQLTELDQKIQAYLQSPQRKAVRQVIDKKLYEDQSLLDNFLLGEHSEFPYYALSLSSGINAIQYASTTFESGFPAKAIAKWISPAEELRPDMAVVYLHLGQRFINEYLQEKEKEEFDMELEMTTGRPEVWDVEFGRPRMPFAGTPWGKAEKLTPLEDAYQTLCCFRDDGKLFPSEEGIQKISETMRAASQLINGARFIELIKDAELFENGLKADDGFVKNVGSLEKLSSDAFEVFSKTCKSRPQNEWKALAFQLAEHPEHIQIIKTFGEYQSFNEDSSRYLTVYGSCTAEGFNQSYLSLIAKLPNELRKQFFENIEELTAKPELFKHLYNLGENQKTKGLIEDYFKYKRKNQKNKVQAIEMLLPEDIPRIDYIREYLRITGMEFNQATSISEQLDELNKPVTSKTITEADRIVQKYSFLTPELKKPIKNIIRLYGAESKEVLTNFFDSFYKLNVDKKNYAAGVFNRDWEELYTDIKSIEGLDACLQMALYYIELGKDVKYINLSCF